MTALVLLAVYGWPILALLLFALLPARRAAVAVAVLGWLFLPPLGGDHHVSGVPDQLSKLLIVSASVLVGMLAFDSGRLFSLRPRWTDLPVAVACLCPFLTSMSNGLGPKDGVLTAFMQTVAWGLPYLIGRLYFADLQGLRELAIGIFLGGLIYAPLCLFEMRMSPELNRMVYGFDLGGWEQTKRWGGWRPMIFMRHGLMLGMWMATASLVGIGLWASGSLRRIGPIPIGWWVMALLATTVLCKALGALALLGLGILILAAVRWLRTSVLMAALLLVPTLYMTTRATGMWSGANLVGWVKQSAGQDRAGSIAVRFQNEDQLAQRALQRPWLGWGEWNRSRVFDPEEGVDISITDGMWIITLGHNGLVGLISLTVSILAGAIVLWWRYPAALWLHPAVGPAAALAVMLGLYMVDNLLNNMVNPLYMMAAGGLCALRPPRLVAMPAPNVRAARRTAPLAPLFPNPQVQ